MGTPDFAVPILRSIKNSGHNILSVYTQNPKRKNRGQKESLTPVHEFSKENNFKVRHPEQLNTDEEFNFFKKAKPDVVVVVAYGKVLPKKLLNIKDIKFINVHASLLPKWRGAAPIQRSIMNLDKETGISIMKIVSKLDAGPVMMKSKINLSTDDNYESVNKALSILGAKMIVESLKLIEQNKTKFVEQDENLASYAQKIDKSEAKINWNEKAKKVIAKINAFYPSPGSWFKHNGSRVKITKAQERRLRGKPGEILKENFTIACRENSIEILELQKEGKKKMKTSEYLKGNKLEIGSNVGKNL
tara:strand:- start:706 stop:1614 length:909 start_codon:yes stop_codon:yes gene_type:complete